MKTIKKVLIVIGLASVLLCGRGYAVPVNILKYAFDGDTKNATSKAAEITATTFESYLNRNAAFVTGNPGKAFEDDGWSGLGNYYYYSLAATQGYKVSIAGLSFDQKKTSNGVKTWELTYRVGESGSFVSAATGSADFTDWTNASASLSEKTDLQNATSTIYLRVKGTGASNENKKWDLDNVLLTGDTQARASLSTIVSSAPSARVLTNTQNVQYVLSTTNDALSGGTATAETLNYTLGFASQNGLSFATNNGSGIGRGNSNNNIINVNTATSGTKGGSLNVSSSNSWRQSLPATLTSVDVYQAASLTVNGGSSLQIANANTTDGGQRAAARVKTLTRTGGDSVVGINGLTAGGHGIGSVVSQNSNINGTAVVSGNVLNGTYSATYQVGLEHDDLTIVGTSDNDLGTFTRAISKTITGNNGNQSVTLDIGRNLDGLWAKSDKTVGSLASFMDGILSNQRTVSTSWRNAIPGECDLYNLSSDVLTLTGTGDDIFVLQMNYDELLLPFAENEIFPKLSWLNNEGNWVNAVFGNIGGTPNFVGDVAYNSSTMFVLGNYGVDTSGNVVWAVINHNSEFAVPEPATIALLGIGALCLIRRKKH